MEDWEHNVAKITSFWSSVGLKTGRYHGNPLSPHVKLSVEPHHFARWLQLFEETLDELCTDAGKDYLLDKARRIARSLEMGVAVAGGVLP